MDAGIGCNNGTPSRPGLSRDLPLD